jgi:hypothetical protein
MLNREQGIIIDPQDGKSCEVYADADLCGNWNRSTAMNDVSTTKYRTGYIISFAGCPIKWASKMQTQITLSTIEYLRLLTMNLCKTSSGSGTHNMSGFLHGYGQSIMKGRSCESLK